MEQAGFIEIREQVFKVPTREWKDNSNTKRSENVYLHHWRATLEGTHCGYLLKTWLVEGRYR
ncbi:hypothetical protein BJX63DRAFT_411976 [Aspergillus granulosus]|uniref:Uncharacterized protein n=1 Tax=Aspergillus granulosus TaxID=176169 RepID=A0ABR4GY86_9EURO